MVFHPTTELTTRVQPKPHLCSNAGWEPFNIGLEWVSLPHIKRGHFPTASGVIKNQWLPLSGNLLETPLNHHSKFAGNRKFKTLKSITLKMAHPHQNLAGDRQPSYRPADNSPFTINAILSGADEVPPSYQRPDDVALCYFDHSIASPMFLQPYEDIDFSIGLDECHGTDAQQSAEPWSETGWPLTDMDAATYMNFQPESLFELNHQSEW